MLPWTKLYLGDCLRVMPTLPAGSVQMVFADLPYGVTKQKWDLQICLLALGEGNKHVLSPTGCVAMTAIQPFSAKLVMQWPELFRYSWVWEKTKPGGFLQARNRPLRAHEDILIFGNRVQYFPQGLLPVRVKSGRKNKAANGNYRKVKGCDYIQTVGNFPRSVVRFQQETKGVHPTQKPTSLVEYLIKTYTREGDTVLDPTAGSMTTAVAALRTGRNAICIEKDPNYFKAGAARVVAERKRLKHERQNSLRGADGNVRPLVPTADQPGRDRLRVGISVQRAQQSLVLGHP